MTGHIEIDHVFLIVSGQEIARSMMVEAGLRVNYSRAHPGQGSANMCACLDDMFLELLWHDGSDVSPESERITLGERLRGNGSPLGVSWRGSAMFKTEPYVAPFLPEGATIPVAAKSLDPSMPFVFQTPGGTKPIERTDQLIGNRQAPGLATLGHCKVLVPDPQPVQELLKPFDKLSVEQGTSGFEITILDNAGKAGRTVRWTSAL